MKAKKLKEVLTGLIVLLLTLFPVNNLKANGNVKSTETLKNFLLEEFNYEFEIREGILWVLVYNETGNLVDEYPAD